MNFIFLLMKIKLKMMNQKIFDILNKHKTPNSQITIKVEEDKFKLANLSKIVSKKDELKKLVK